MLPHTLKRLAKYLIEGMVIALVAYWIPNMKLSPQEIATIALTAAATYSVLDYFAPSMSGTARAGSALTVGARLAGF